MDKINEALSANDRFNHDLYKDKYSPKESEYFGIYKEKEPLSTLRG